jgi:DNA-binding PadR family transcriptional regulator
MFHTHEGRHFIGRRHRGHGFGRFGGGGGGFDGAEFRAGRKLSGGDLQLLVLALLAENPSHGYELIKALEDRSSGFYAPSPGMVYPALTYLEELGYATVEADGAKKLYRITDAGRAHLEQNRAIVDAMFEQLERIGRKMERVRRFFADDESAGEESDGRGGSSELHAARHALKQALMEKRGASAEEVSRIAEILKQAAAAIKAKA